LVFAAYSRADLAENQRRSFFAYVDEFQSFTTMALANMLSELRKYRVGFTIAHQYLHQLDADIQHAVLGNAGTIISFRVGAEDAPYLAREFVGEFEEIDLIQLPNHRIYLKLMIDGSPSKPFSALTLSPGRLKEPLLPSWLLGWFQVTIIVTVPDCDAVEEDARIQKRAVSASKVRIRTVIDLTEEIASAKLEEQTVEITRVPLS
jgi:hypothetical protein